MTREKAEKIVRGITDKIECNTVDIDDWAGFWGFTREEYEEFLDTAIKASEQLNALNKIRAEIKQKCDRINSLASILSYTAHREIQELLCEIMDLCKAESEEQT